MPAHDSTRRRARKARRLMYFGLWFGLILAPGDPCTTAQAQSNAVVATLDDTLPDWMRKHNVHAAAFAALKDGRLAGSPGYAGLGPRETRPHWKPVEGHHRGVRGPPDRRRTPVVHRPARDGDTECVPPVWRAGRPALQGHHDRATLDAPRRARDISARLARRPRYGDYGPARPGTAARKQFRRRNALQQYRLSDARHRCGNARRPGLRAKLPRRRARAHAGGRLYRSAPASAGAQRRLDGVGDRLRQ